MDSNTIDENNSIELFNKLSLFPLSKMEIENDVIKFYFDDKYLLKLNKNLEDYDIEDELFIFFFKNKMKTFSFSPKNKFVLEEK